MAIVKVDSQGIKVYIADVPATAWATEAAAITGIHGGNTLGCLQSIGDITQTRATTEYSCMTSNEVTTALGSITTSPISLGLLWNPADAAGQADLKLAFKNKTNVIIGFEFNDADTSVGSTGASGSIIWLEAGVSVVTRGIPKDGAVTYSVTIVAMSDLYDVDMVAGT